MKAEAIKIKSGDRGIKMPCFINTQPWGQKYDYHHLIDEDTDLDKIQTVHQRPQSHTFQKGDRWLRVEK